MTRLNRVQKISFIDLAAAAAIDEIGTGRHLCKAVCVKQAFSFSCQGQNTDMHRTGRQHLAKPVRAVKGLNRRAQIARLAGPALYSKAQRGQPVCDHRTDGPKPVNRNRQAFGMTLRQAVKPAFSSRLAISRTIPQIIKQNQANPLAEGM